MLKINLLVENLGNTQVNYATLHAANAWASKNTAAPIFFYQDISLDCLTPKCPVMQLIEAWNQEGISVATTYGMVDFLLQCIRPRHKFFYMWDIEFNDPVEQIVRKFKQQSQLGFITRSKDYSLYLEQTLQINPARIHIVDSFDPTQLLDLFKSLK